jgi:tryptophan-rich sensory protein
MNYAKLVVSLLICQLAGVIGSIFTTPAISTWYAGVQKPFFVPPNWLFAPAWITLFVLMGISLYLIWDKGFKENRIAIWVFGVQLGLNILWSAIFFGMRNPGCAFIEIIGLWMAILATIIAFKRVSRRAAWLLVPYICWVSFAAVLNFSIWMLN